MEKKRSTTVLFVAGVLALWVTMVVHDLRVTADVEKSVRSDLVDQVQPPPRA